MFFQFESCVRTVQKLQDVSNVFDLLFRRLAEYHDVVGIDDDELPPNAEEKDVHRAFEGCRRVVKSKKHSNNLV